MTAEIPNWLIVQMTADVEAAKSGLQNPRPNERFIRRALLRLEQDAHYIREFSSGAVSRREGGLR